MERNPELETEDNYRFVNGMWFRQQDVDLYWANSVYKSQSKNGGRELYSVLTTKPQRSRGDILNMGTVTTSMSSPSDGVITFTSTHHKGAQTKTPNFDILHHQLKPADVVVETSASAGTLSSGGIAAVENHEVNNYGVEFVEKNSGRMLTKLGFRSVGYAKDFRTNRKYGKNYMTVQLHLSVQEKVYGLGERFGPLIKNGQTVEIWQRDGGTSSDQAYKNVPFYLTNRGYGVFVDETANVNFEIQSERTTRVNIVVAGESIKLHIIYGPTVKEILHKYSLITGFPALPPAWSFGLWLSTSFTTDYSEKTVRQFIDGMKQRDIPLSVFHFDCFWMKGLQWTDFEFDTDYFPDAGATIANLKKEYGLRVCAWINPYIAQEGNAFIEAQSKGYLVKTLDDDTWQTDEWQAGMGLVDFTNPDAWKWFQDRLKGLMDLGVDAFKTDFGEAIPAHRVKFADGSDPMKMHNFYTQLYNQCVFELLERERGPAQACLFARSGTAGGQRFPVHWGGDCESTYEAMAESLRGGLSLTLSGYGFWSHDIGGFEGYPDPAVYKRWVAFGLLSSHSRLHGSGSYRVPWAFDDESTEVLRKFTKLKLSLMPYLFAHAVSVHKNGGSLMRAMLTEFEEDSSAWTADTQFMLGPNLLVAPVFEGATGRVNYYVPEGDWYGWLDGKIRQGGKYYTEIHGFESVPLLVRPNSIVVTGSDDKPEYAWNDNIVIHVYDVTSAEAHIPDHIKIGNVAATVTATKVGDKTQVKVEGSVGNWSVNVVGKDVKSAVISGAGQVTV